MSTIRIAIVEDRDLARKGLKATIGELADCAIVGICADIPSLGEVLKKESPQVLILDDTLPGVDTRSLVRRLKDEYLTLRIIIFGSNVAAAAVYELIDAGADGFIYKGEDLSSVLGQAIAFALKGKPFLSPHIALAVMNYTQSTKPIELTERLKAVLSLLALGFSVKETARTLNITPKAVYNARDRLKELLGVDSSADILKKAVALKLVKSTESDSDNAL
jgi:DNA-binding NarL/FixJ family response regulator